MTLPRMLLLVLLVFACTVLGVGVVALSERDERGRADADGRPVSAATPADGPLAVLHEWDRQRAAAWAAGDVAGLRSLYTRRSTAGARDAARLSRWVDRGLRVRRMQTQLLRARLLEQRRGLLVLSVTDRIARAVAVHGHREISLPDDFPSTWRITMRLMAGEWRVASVTR